MDNTCRRQKTQGELFLLNGSPKVYQKKRNLNLRGKQGR